MKNEFAFWHLQHSTIDSRVYWAIATDQNEDKQKNVYSNITLIIGYQNHATKNTCEHLKLLD